MDLSTLHWLTTEQAAQYLQITEQTLVVKRAKRNGPKFCRIGSKLIRYKRADLDAWLESGTA